MAPALRRLPVLLCLLGVAFCALAVASSGASVTADAVQTQPTQPQATDELALPERVVLDGTPTRGSVETDRDVAASIDSSGTGIDGTYERALLQEQLANAEDDAERREVLATWASRLESSLETLRARDRQARRAYVAGDRSEQGLLYDLRSVNDRAEQLELVADDVVEEAEEQGAFDVRNDIRSLRGDLIALQGPVRTQMSETAAGNRNASRVYVEATENGTVLATIDGNEYHREAVRHDLLQSRGTDGIGSGDELVAHTAQELYPVHNEHYTFFSPGATVVLFQLYRIEAYSPHYPHGELRSYVDGVSETVFWEYQRLELDEDLPTASSHQRLVNETTVTVERTYPGGPARVRVSEDGDAVDGATLEVDGATVAETEDGVGWVVLPSDASTLRVTDDDTDVEVDVTW